jgi:chloramphenicol O-acetyltransferase
MNSVNFKTCAAHERRSYGKFYKRVRDEVQVTSLFNNTVHNKEKRASGEMSNTSVPWARHGATQVSALALDRHVT